MLLERLKGILGIEKKFKQSFNTTYYLVREEGQQKVAVLNEHDRYCQELLGIEQIPPDGTLKNGDAREWYLRNIYKINKAVAKCSSLEEQARLAYDLRNWLRIKTRALMAGREEAIQLEQTDPVLTYEEVCLRQFRKSTRRGLARWDEVCVEVIRCASHKTRQSVNKEVGIEFPLKSSLPSDFLLESKEEIDKLDWRMVKEMSEVKKGNVGRINKRVEMELEV